MMGMVIADTVVIATTIAGAVVADRAIDGDGWVLQSGLPLSSQRKVLAEKIR